MGRKTLAYARKQSDPWSLTNNVDILIQNHCSKAQISELASNCGTIEFSAKVMKRFVGCRKAQRDKRHFLVPFWPKMKIKKPKKFHYSKN